MENDPARGETQPDLKIIPCKRKKGNDRNRENAPKTAKTPHKITLDNKGQL